MSDVNDMHELRGKGAIVSRNIKDIKFIRVVIDKGGKKK